MLFPFFMFHLPTFHHHFNLIRILQNFSVFPLIFSVNLSPIHYSLLHFTFLSHTFHYTLQRLNNLWSRIHLNTEICHQIQQSKSKSNWDVSLVLIFKIVFQVELITKYSKETNSICVHPCVYPLYTPNPFNHVWILSRVKNASGCQAL
jgi:hypothetical protein